MQDHEKVRFAIVEDEAIEREGMEVFILDKIPNSLVAWTAMDGEEGLVKVHEDPPDILIVDIEMPVMNGLQLCEALFQENFPGVVLIHTAYARFGYAKKAITLVVYDYILKPMDDQDMREVLLRCVERFRELRRIRQEREDRADVVRDLKKYVMNLLMMDSLDEKQRNLFFDTVGWPKGEALQTFILSLTSPASFTPGQMKQISEARQWLEGRGFLLSGEYVGMNRYLFLMQPSERMEPAKLYTLVYLFWQLFLTRLGSFTAQGPCMDLSSLSQSFRLVFLGKERKEMPEQTWRYHGRQLVEKSLGSLNRYLKDADLERARRLIMRLMQAEEENKEVAFWETVMLCHKAAGDFSFSGEDDVWRDLFEKESMPQAWADAFLSCVEKQSGKEQGGALEDLCRWMDENLLGDVSLDRKSTRLNSSHNVASRMPSSA